MKKAVPLHSLSEKVTSEGRLAQLVQSVCLTSRGSGVRIPQRPQRGDEGCLQDTPLSAHIFITN